MVSTVVMPQFYETMQAGRVIRWLKKEGDEVEKGKPIVEVETEKTTVQIEAPVTGSLAKIFVAEGDDIPILQTIALIATAEDGPLSADALSEETYSAQSPRKLERTGTPVEELFEERERDVRTPTVSPVSPLAKKLAQQHGIDIQKVRGTGPGGRIVKDDVMKAIEDAGSTTGFEEEPARKKSIPMTRMRKMIAERMSYSARTIPQVTLSTEVDVSEVVKLREKLLSGFESEFGVRISYTDILVKAVASMLRQETVFNSRLEDDHIVLREDINIGIAVSVDEGLVVPVLRNADRKTLGEIAVSAKQLIERANQGTLSSSEATGGTFTITNLGLYDVDIFTPLVNPPETAILGVGTVRDKPVVIDGQVVVRPIAFLSLSFDHRVIDGALAAQFLRGIKQMIESPSFAERLEHRET